MQNEGFKRAVTEQLEEDIKDLSAIECNLNNDIDSLLCNTYHPKCDTCNLCDTLVNIRILQKRLIERLKKIEENERCCE